MQVPILTHSQFLLLAGLLDGRERTRTELRRLVGCRDSCFSSRMNQLHEDGLVEIARVGRPGGPARGLFCFKITAAGRQAWQDALDFYLSIGRRWADGTRAAGDGDNGVEWRQPIAPRPRIRHAEVQQRLPTPDEERRILAAAPREFELLYRTLRDTGATLDQLIALDVADLDGDRLRLPADPRGPTRLRVDGPIKRLLDEAIGGRTRGPLFANPSGRRWPRARVYRTFQKLRNAAGVSGKVKLLGGRRPRHKLSRA